MRKVEVIPVVVGTLRCVRIKFEQWIERIGIIVNVEESARKLVVTVPP